MRTLLVAGLFFVLGVLWAPYVPAPQSVLGTFTASSTPPLSVAQEATTTATTTPPKRQVEKTATKPKTPTPSQPKNSTPSTETPKPIATPSAPTSTVSSATENTTPTPIAPAPQQAASFKEQLEQSLHARINAERTQAGLAALAWDSTLLPLARSHSADMLARDYFSHADPEGCSVGCRAKNASYTYWALGENIYMLDGYPLDVEDLTDTIVEGWMQSPGHRANILNDNFTHQALGIAVEGKEVYVTEVLAKPR